jgi:DNA polymerase elongation subunit (family B)
MHGISYKDAAHRLYHSEVKKLLAEDDVRTKIGDICENIAAKVDKDIRNRIREIDERASELATDDS